jgi:hypothetical protein
VSVSIEGLSPGQYTLSASEARFATAQRVDLNLHVSAALPAGLHPILVRAASADGWQDSYRIQHFVERR